MPTNQPYQPPNTPVYDLRFDINDNYDSLLNWITTYLSNTTTALTVAYEESKTKKPHIHVYAHPLIISLEAIRKSFKKKFPEITSTSYYMKQHKNPIHKIKYNNKGLDIRYTNNITLEEAKAFGTKYVPNSAKNKKGDLNYKTCISYCVKHLRKDDTLFVSYETVARTVYDYYLDNDIPLNFQYIKIASETIYARLNNDNGWSRLKSYLNI